MGIEIKTLVNEQKQPGDYTVHFPVTDQGYSAGLYVVQMKCNDFIQTREMVITK